MLNYLFTKTPLAFFIQNLWRDEAFTVLMSEQSVGEILQTTATDFNPPLYYLFMHYWMLIFGTSEIAVRSVSLLFYVLTIFIMFEIMVLVFQISFKRALIYFTLIITNPMLLTYAFEARMYMMAAFFITLSYFALWSGKKKLYIVAMILALYTHYFTLLILLAQIVAKLPVCKFKIGNLLKIGNWKLEIIPIILFIPWLLFLLSYHDFATTEFWIIKPPLNDILYLPFVLYTGYQRVFGQYYHGHVGYTSFHLGVNLLLWGLIITPPKRFILPLLLWSFFPPLILFGLSLVSTPIYHPRYFMFSVVGLLLYIIQIIDTAFPPQKKGSFLGKNYVMMFIVIILLFVNQLYNNLNLRYNAKRTISHLYQEIGSSIREGDRVYLTNELDYFLAKYYIDDASIYIFGIAYEEIHSYVGKVLIPPTSISSGIPTYPARAFFVYYDRYVVRSEM